MPAKPALQQGCSALVCRLQAKCEAFIATRFNEVKFCASLEELSKDTWMRLMYISSYKGLAGKETVVHR